jgi:trehalose/maltose hydrolase-like predicted phosphorylase
VDGLDRTFDAVVLGWFGTAVPDGRASATAVRSRVEALCAAGVDVAVVSGATLDEVDGQLGARPAGPGRLFLALSRGAELVQVGPAGPGPIRRRPVRPDQEAALDTVATSVVAGLSRQGRRAQVAPAGPDRREIAVAPGSIPARPAGGARTGGVDDLTAVVRDAAAAARAAGLPGARVTADAARVQVRLTDAADSMRAILASLAEGGIGPGLVLVIGDEFAPFGGAAGRDALLLVPEAARATAVSVGADPAGLPAVVRHVGGGPPALLRLLDEQLQRRRQRCVPAIDEDPEWVIEETGRDPLRRRVTETLFTLGAGGYATRGSVEESTPGSLPLVLASGIYTGTGSGQHLLPGPGWTGVELEPPPEEDRRVLDLRTGVLLREEAGTGTRARTVRFAAVNRPGLMVLRAEAPAGRLRPGPPLQPPREGPAVEGQLDDTHWARTGVGGPGGIAAVAVDQREDHPGLTTVDRIAAYVAEARRQPVLAPGVAALHAADALGFDRLLAEHRAGWADRWDAVDVAIPGDPAAQLAARFALFQLWCNADAHDRAAVGARGLSGTGYSGHVFWDTDVFVLPAVVSMDPAAACAMVAYRLRRLRPAQGRARAAGHAGAHFPWESAADGDDVTPATGYLGGTEVPVLTGQYEEHITADVAWAACRYAEWSGDAAFRAGPARRLLRETARYWASRCRLDDDGRAHIDDVIGPDEYHERVTDNAFTNVMARWNLRTAAAGARAMERRRWDDLADRLVDGFDPASGCYEQFAGYFGLEPLTMADVGAPPAAADVLLGRDRVARSQLIKQPDVLMLHHLVPDEVHPGSLVPNVDFYGPRTAHGSSLSPAVMASLLARAGRPDEALELLRVALSIDLDGQAGLTSAGLHLATLGGVWQALLTGFAGVRVREGVLHLDPCLPSAWRGLRLRFRCLGRRIRLDLTPRATELRTDGPVAVQPRGQWPRQVTGRAELPHQPPGPTRPRSA